MIALGILLGIVHSINSDSPSFPRDLGMYFKNGNTEPGVVATFLHTGLLGGRVSSLLLPPSQIIVWGHHLSMLEGHVWCLLCLQKKWLILMCITLYKEPYVYKVRLSPNERFDITVYLLFSSPIILKALV